MKKITLSLSFVLSLCYPAYAQNLNWSSYVRTTNTPVGASNYTMAYTSGTLSTIMTVSVTSSAGTGIFDNTSPRYSNNVNPLGTGSTCLPTGLLVSVNWANKTSDVRLDFNLGNGTDGVCGPVKFVIGDINSDGSTFMDMVDITATNAAGGAITPNKPASIPANNSYITGGCSYSWSYSDCNQSTTTGNILRYTGTSACTDWGNNFVEVGTTGTKVKTISIRYYSGNSGIQTNPASQYIVISNFLTSGFTPCAITYLLPIEMTYFTAKNNNDTHVDLNWETATETNNAYFTIERSSDGVNFEAIGRVEGAGTSHTKRSYSYADESLIPGINYYRIKQTDTDMESRYSDMAEVNISPSKVMISDMHPNPAGDFIDFNLYSPQKGNSMVEIMDATGRCIYHELSAVERGKTPVHIDTKFLEKGIYTLKVSIENTSYQSVSRLVKN